MKINLLLPASVYFFLIFFLFSFDSFSQHKRDFYEIRIYHLENTDHESRLEEYLEVALLPALHRTGINNVGVFKPISTDTTASKAIYVYIPYTSADQFFSLPEKLLSDNNYLSKGSDYINAAYNKPAYERIETFLLQAFEGMPNFELTDLANEKVERVYELRSYESATEQLFENKVRMFNEGEIAIFQRLGFNPVFFGEVIAGNKMPNLMYMTAFFNMTSRDKHWESFGKDEAWEQMSTLEEYQNNVSHIDIILLQATRYSDI